MAYYTKLPIVLLSELAAGREDSNNCRIARYLLGQLAAEIKEAKWVAAFGLLKAEAAAISLQSDLTCWAKTPRRRQLSGSRWISFRQPGRKIQYPQKFQRNSCRGTSPNRR